MSAAVISSSHPNSVFSQGARETSSASWEQVEWCVSGADTKDLLSVAKETQISACAISVFDIAHSKRWLEVVG